MKLQEEKGYSKMKLEDFNKLVLGNYDFSFNYKEIYYMISTYEENGKNYISLANENKWFVDFESIDDLDLYVLIDKPMAEIISCLSEEDIYW